MPMCCARSPAGRRTARKRGVSWRWPRSMTEAPAPRRPGSAGSRSRLCGPFDRLRRVVKFNAHGPDGLIDRKPSGRPSRLTDAHRAALVARVDAGPIPAVHGVVRWRLIDLIQWLWEELRISISKQTLSRELRALDYRKLSARPRHHAKSEAAVSAFKKTSPPVWRRLRKPRLAASGSRSGSRMRRGSGRRTRSRGAGPNAAPALPPPRTRGRSPPTSSGRSARRRAKAQGLSCPAAPPRA